MLLCRLRPAELDDLPNVASWVTSEAICRLWSGPEMRYPLDLNRLPTALGFHRHGSFVLVNERDPVAFGQIVVKRYGRGHLARLIVDPAVRGRGLGARLAEALLEQAIANGHAPVSLNVDPANRPALSIYRKLGFRAVPRPLDEPASGALYLEVALMR